MKHVVKLYINYSEKRLCNYYTHTTQIHKWGEEKKEREKKQPITKKTSSEKHPVTTELGDE